MPETHTPPHETTVSSGSRPVANAPRNNESRGGVSMRAIAQMAVFAALIGAMGLIGAIAVPGLVPITVQTLGVMLAGAILGPWRGAGAVALLELVVALGMPLLAGGRGGIGVFAGPSVGYIIGWIFGAMVIGLIVHGARGTKRPQWWTVALGAVVGGIGVIYLFGIPLQSAITGLGLGETIVTSLVFLPGDAIKAVICVLVTMALWKAYPRAFRA